ncbi:MAG TPA: ATP-binding protein [Burkholderiales bacterium]|nr:ATP-binding protein [Burkholderiales bacterium]
MRLFPRTLLWRTFLLIAALILASVAAYFEIFRTYEREPRAQQVAQMVVSVVNLTRAALVSARPDLRRELLIDLSEREGIRVYPAEADERLTDPPPDRPVLQLAIAEIRRQLGRDTRVAFARDGIEAFWVSFRIEDDEYWVMLPRERVERRLALQWLGWAALTAALALLGAFLVVFRVRRPLAALTRAAADIGRGRIPAPLEESGPAEIQTVSHAFNQMARDLARLEDDRALILAGVSHDLRTPLARLRLGLEMAGADPQLKTGMTADIDDMDRIIGQFLDFARAARGEPLAPVDLAALAREIAGRYRETGHVLADEIAAVPELPLRSLAVRRLISNLLDNAFRYGERDVLLRVAPEGGGAAVEVLDRGPGIPAAEVERLKQPFTRIETETARSGKGGSGLGLAIVDRIARMHGGTFDLLPRQGGGLIARVTFPRGQLQRDSTR